MEIEEYHCQSTLHTCNSSRKSFRWKRNRCKKPIIVIHPQETSSNERINCHNHKSKDAQGADSPKRLCPLQEVREDVASPNYHAVLPAQDLQGEPNHYSPNLCASPEIREAPRKDRQIKARAASQHD